MNYLLNNNMLVVVYLISNVHVQKVLPIFQDPIPIDRGLAVREAMPHKLNINQHTTKPMLVNGFFLKTFMHRLILQELKKNLQNKTRKIRECNSCMIYVKLKVTTPLWETIKRIYRVPF